MELPQRPRLSGIQDAGDTVVRAGSANVVPKSDKHIGTLVDDIKQVLQGKVSVSKSSADNLGVSLAQMLVERLCEGPKEGRLRPSNFSYGDRKLWYAVNHPELAGVLEPEAKQKFLYGDIVETEMLFLARAAGHDVQCENLEVEYEGIKGRIDAIIDGVLIDVKSAGSRAFDKFKHHQLEYNDPFGYLDQLSLYGNALRDNDHLKIKGEVAFLAVNKETGEICLDIYKINNKDYRAEIIRKGNMLRRDQLPARCHSPVAHGASGNARLGLECTYCPFKRECWKDSNNGRGLRSFLYSTGIVHLVDVKREPEVKEIT